MKQNRAILKDLQESGQSDVNIGHRTPQSGQGEEVANINDVEKRPVSDELETRPTFNPSRISTEPQQDFNQGILDRRQLANIDSPLELAEVIAVWPMLPDTIRIAISAIVKAFIGRGEPVK